MRCSAFLFVAISLLIVGLEMTSTMTLAFRVDCTKFVFAPRCRGVAAKRSRTTFAMQDGLTFDDDLRRQMDDDDGDSLLTTGLGSSSSSSSSSDLFRRNGVSHQLRLQRSRPNPSSTVNELRRSSIDAWPISDFRSKREISSEEEEAFNEFFRTKKDMKSDAASAAAAGQREEGRRSTQPSSRHHATASSAADTDADAWFHPYPRRTIRQTSFNRQVPRDLPTEIN